MKTTLVAAALLGSATASVHHGHAHDIFHVAKRNDTCVPSCTTIYTTITGDFICTRPSGMSHLERPPH